MKLWIFLKENKKRLSEKAAFSFDKKHLLLILEAWAEKLFLKPIAKTSLVFYLQVITI